MKPFKDVVSRIAEKDKIKGRVNFNVFRYQRELDVCECEGISNEELMFHIIGHEFDKTAGVVQRDMCSYIIDNIQEEETRIRNYIQDKNTDYEDYLDVIGAGIIPPDNLCLFYCCKMYNFHAAVILNNSIWYSFHGEGTLDDCRLVFVYVGGNTFKKTVPISKKKMPLTITFEAGYKKPVVDRKDGSKEDPSYHPSMSKGHNPQKPAKGKKNAVRRKSAVLSERKTRTGYYNDPDYVVNVTSSSSSEDDDVFLGDEGKGSAALPSLAQHSIKHKAKSVRGSDVEVVDRASKCATDRGRGNMDDSDATIDYTVEDYICKRNPVIVMKKIKKVVVLPSTKRTVPTRTFHFGVKKPKHTYNCKECSKRFLKYSALYQHKRFKHGCTYKCNVCSLKLKSKGSLAEHYRRHAKQTLPYLCHVCGKKFLRPSLLQNHSTVHSDDRNWKCAYPNCDAAYKQKSTLTKHVKRKHSGADRVTCSKCPMFFESLKDLNQHMQTHNPPNIPCRICGKKFRHYSSRTLHEKKCVVIE